MNDLLSPAACRYTKYSHTVVEKSTKDTKNYLFCKRAERVPSHNQFLRTGYMMTNVLATKVDQESDNNFTLEEQFSRLKRQVALLEARNCAIG